MSKVDSTEIESFSVTYLKLYLQFSKFLQVFISENDRTPCWDGQIFVYRSESKRNDTFLRKIDVQVKGELSENLDDNEITYNVLKANLRNYLAGGGIAYYVVRLSSDFKEHTIYYAHLTQKQLQSYINYCDEKNFNSTSIYLKKVPDIQEYTELLFNIPQSTIKDISIDTIIKSNDFDGFSIKYTGVKYKDDPYDYIFNHPTTVYAHNKLLGIDIPIQENVQFTSIAFTESQYVKIHDIEYYFQIQIERHNSTEVKHGIMLRLLKLID